MEISISNDWVNFRAVEINTLADLVNYATKYNYSTGKFKDNYRTKDNFEQAQSIAIDVDNDDPNIHYSIADAALLFSNYRYVILPSKSHQIEKNGRVADRFRIILFLDQPITSAKDFTATWNELFKFYPAADTACKDASRFYYPSPSVYAVNENGNPWPVTKYVKPEINELDAALMTGERGQLAKSTMHFLTYGAPAGKRNVALFKASKDMQEQGFTIEECKTRVSSMISLTGNWGTNFLNDKDIQTIESAYREAAIYPPRPGEATRKSVFTFQTVADMVKEAGNLEWIVSDLLSVGGFSMIVGPPKAGKSTLVRQLVLSICRGANFLDRKVKRGSVMYLTFEEQPSILKEQFDLVGIGNNDPIVIHTGAVFDDRALEDLEAAINDFNPSLVVLDTLFDISNLEEINSYKQVKDALSRIRAIARNTNTHILGVHHSNKMGGFLGSQAIYGAVDTMVEFIQQRDRRYLKSSGKHGTHYDDKVHEIVFNPLNQTYTLQTNTTSRRDDKL